MRHSAPAGSNSCQRAPISSSPHEGQSHELQRKARVRAALIGDDLARQLGQLFGIDAGEIHLPARLEHVPGFHIGHRIALGKPVRHRVAHHLAAGLENPPGNVGRTAGLDAFG
jgi:hypothetical protein